MLINLHILKFLLA